MTGKEHLLRGLLEVGELLR